ncbi:MAG: metal ABC transporter permease [Fibrobacter sp.]|nr:metal ABC transporter permease [Fibrobacter sp.]
MIPDLLQYEFMRNAFLAGLLVSVACGVVGTLVVVNRLSFLAGGVAHAAYGGLGLAAFARWSPESGIIPFALGSSLLMGFVSRKNKERSDTVIGVMWAVGMALGIILIDLTPGYYADLMSYLFGSIMAVSQQSLLLMVVLDFVILICIILLYKEILSVSYDEEFASISGVPARALYYVILMLIALTVIMLIQAVGLILVIALFTIPASIAELFTKDLKRMMIVSSLLGMLFTTAGLLVSYLCNITAGASIVLSACIGYGTALIIIKVKKSKFKAVIMKNRETICSTECSALQDSEHRK